MSHPYDEVPDYAKWRASVAAQEWHAVDPVVRLSTKIKKTDKIMTAGSCFAQHIARHLSSAGFNHFVSEKGHSILSESVREKCSYGTYSARYGNIYTAKQLLQLFQRALGLFAPKEPGWKHGKMWIDPFRPTIQPGGFSSEKELLLDRNQHLRAVQAAMSKVDIFVFTLGLTESWRSKEDGAVFPLCPGVRGGDFRSDRYEFVNFDVDEIVDDLVRSIDLFRKINPNIKVLLTVSPVPLAATAEDRHVLVSTCISKSVLRIAAHKVTLECDDVEYFPSYEIITGTHNRGRYFADDLRSVTEQGVQHVMDLFFKHAVDREGYTATMKRDDHIAFSDDDNDLSEDVLEVLCEEALLDTSVER